MRRPPGVFGPPPAAAGLGELPRVFVPTAAAQGSGPGAGAAAAAAPWEGSGMGCAHMGLMHVDAGSGDRFDYVKGQSWGAAADEPFGMGGTGCLPRGQGPLVPAFLPHMGMRAAWDGGALGFPYPWAACSSSDLMELEFPRAVGQPLLQPPELPQQLQQSLSELSAAPPGASRRCAPVGASKSQGAAPASLRPPGRQAERLARKHDEEVQMVGPNFCKILVPNFIAGAIIGKDGVMIGEIELISKCQMHISAPNKYFPGTTDRILLVGGTVKGLEDCINRVLKRLQDISPNPARPLMVKLAVPSSAVSGIIGHQGDAVKRLISTTGCRINASPRVEGIQERLVMIAGVYESLVKATLSVIHSIQSDPHLREHLLISYDLELPLGTWAGNKAEAADPSVPLIHPSKTARYTKRELIEYLQKAAPQEILLRYSILGNIKNTVKSKSTVELVAAVTETWRVRGGQDEESEVEEMIRRALASVMEDAAEEHDHSEEETERRAPAAPAAPAAGPVSAAPGQVPAAPGALVAVPGLALLAPGHVPAAPVPPVPVLGPPAQAAPGPPPEDQMPFGGAVGAHEAAAPAAPSLLEGLLSLLGFWDQDAQQPDRHRRRCCQCSFAGLP